MQENAAFLLEVSESEDVFFFFFFLSPGKFMDPWILPLHLQGV